jgi:hypothetical protein
VYRSPGTLAQLRLVVFVHGDGCPHGMTEIIEKGTVAAALTLERDGPAVLGSLLAHTVDQLRGGDHLR